MTNKTSISSFILILVLGMFSACKKDNNGNQEPIAPNEPEVSYEIPPIDEYMPERLLCLFDSLNVLYRGDTPPSITGDFMAESMDILIIDKVPESHYMIAPGPINESFYYEMREQENNKLSLTFKRPIGSPGSSLFFLEKSDTDSTYYHINDNTALFTDDPIAPPYFKSSKFTSEDFRHAYIIGDGNYFTLYYYEIRDVTSGVLPLNAVLISGKISTDTEGKPTIENFWYGIESMKYYKESTTLNLFIQNGVIPTSGDIIVMQSPNNLVQVSYDYK